MRTLPTVFELLQSGATAVRQVRDVQIEDILGREPVLMELHRVGAYLSSEVVLVTGAGGSIGKELSRQIARVVPRRLVLLDHAEDNLFQIQRELEHDRHVHPSTLDVVLADCKEEERMREVFDLYRPTVVFHAAAYKHVGLMESNPVEAVRNNAIATRLMARISGQAKVKTFVLVSTDKAVDPSTVMGASKALAEFALEAEQARFPATRYCAVRFGNVLGSSGSVVPIFRRQIALGGPVTVTDERMTRYFMTIPEAVQLIIRSGGLGKGGAGGEIYVLEMGEPGADPRPRPHDDRALGPGARPRHRGRDRRPAARREAPRGALQPLRATAADARREDPARRARAPRPARRRRDVRPDRTARPGGRCGRSGCEGVRAVGNSAGRCD